ncbi:MAG: hypothetical protein H8E44_41140 [Planctomycetes bacterium]|nr:hypothetical protein [Planctomycetota bacterium]
MTTAILSLALLGVVGAEGEARERRETALYVVTSPVGGEVRLNGKRAGWEPHLFPFRSRIRRVRVTVELEGHDDHRETIVINTGDIERLELRLKRQAKAKGEGTGLDRLRDGEDELSVVIDPNDAGKESNETNNHASTMSVRDVATASKPAGHADANIDIGIRSFSVSTGDDGGSLAIVMIENLGTFSAPAMQVYFYAGDPDKKESRLLARHRAGPIMPGTVWAVATDLDGLRDGEDRLFVVLDPDDAVKESNETNNRCSTKL